MTDSNRSAGRSRSIQRTLASDELTAGLAACL